MNGNKTPNDPDVGKNDDVLARALVLVKDAEKLHQGLRELLADLEAKR